MWFLDMLIDVNAKTRLTKIDQYRFASAILHRFEMGKRKASNFKLNTSTSLIFGEESDVLADHVPYRTAVGALLYLSRVSQPVLAFAVNQVAAQASKPRVAHWLAAEQILRYVAETKGMTLTYRCSETAEPVGLFTDADCANNSEYRNSISGVVVMGTPSRGPLAARLSSRNLPQIRIYCNLARVEIKSLGQNAGALADWTQHTCGPHTRRQPVYDCPHHE